MPHWNEVLNEVVAAQVDPYHVVMTKYLGELHKKRGGRNIIAYYSGWLQKEGNVDSMAITDMDMNAFIAVIHGMDVKKAQESGLDLLLHTPGGVVEAAEAIGDYLRGIFGTNIEVFVPHMAMSAGTMLACTAKTIHMGKHSSIGPIDPQIFHPAIGRVSAGFALDEFKKAAEEIEEDNTKILVWEKTLGKYYPSFLLQCEESIALAEELAASWLDQGMFAEPETQNEGATQAADTSKETKETTGKHVARKLADYRKEKLHSRHIGIDKARAMGLNVTALETDNELQDLVLTLHHTFMHTFAHTPRTKIIANHIEGVMSYFVPQPPSQ